MARQPFVWLFIITCHFWKFARVQSGLLLRRDEHHSDERHFYCGFENGNCFWKNDLSAKFSWQSEHIEFSEHSVSQHDFTSIAGDGDISLFITRREKGPYTAAMTSPPLSTTNEKACLSFGYIMPDYEAGALNVWKYTENHQKELLFSLYGPQGRRWYKAFVPIGTGANFTLEIEGTYHGHRGLGDIAVDDTDISLDADACLQDADKEPHFDCDFEDNFCSWYSEGDWELRDPSREWQSRHVLCQNDDWYYRELPFFASKTISVLNNGACLSFNYFNHDYMALRIALNLYSSGQVIKEEGKEIWSSPIRFSTLTKASVTLPPGDNFYLAFLAMSHYVAGGYFIIDDLKLSYKGPCGFDGTEPEQKTRYHCDFDTNSTCEWFQRSLPDVGTWTIHQGSTPSAGTGPEKDHTTGAGYYAFLDASRVDTAQLYSPIVDIPSHGACFSFWYHMYGEDIHQLTVWRYNHSAYLEEKRKQVLWKADGSKGENWIQQNITLSEAGKDMSIVLEASRRYFPRGDIAIDDVSLLLDGPCYGDLLKPKVSETTTSTTISPITTTSLDFTGILSTSQDSSTKVPEIHVTGQIHPAVVGSTVRLECGDYDDLVEWSFARPMDRLHGRTSLLGPRVIHFQEINLDDENDFKCRLMNSDQSARSSSIVRITVVKELRARPKLISYDVLDPAAFGSQLTLQCGDGADGASYNWTVTNTNDTLSTYVTESRFTVLQEVTSKYDGKYRCSMSKDGFETAMSNTVTINVVKGRTCQTHQDCKGHGNYTGMCVTKRCVCLHEELLRDTKCLAKPPQPMIDVVPRLHNNIFGVGENLNLRCKTGTPLLESASYVFKRNDIELTQAGGSDKFHVYHISNASVLDNGLYSCIVKYGDVLSEPSRNRISVQIKEFTDLSCAFEIDFCNWFHEDASKVFLFKYSRVYDKALMTSHGSYLSLNGFDGALLRSSDIKTNYFQACLTFQYRMDSDDSISLSVWIYKHALESDAPSSGKNVWETVGYQGTEWKEASIQIRPQDNFYIVFYGQGHMDIDNFKYSIYGPC